MLLPYRRAMKIIKYDSDGWMMQSIIKNDMSEEDVNSGIPLNPPDIRSLDWEEIKRELNSLMVERGLITFDNLNGGGHQLLVSAVQSVITKKIVQLYKDIGGKNGK